MLQAVAVDDETKALKRISRIIRQIDNVSLSGGFTRPSEVLDFIQSQEVDVVFLDIEMPEVYGLELAEKIFEIKPQVAVVFVTAYDKYALRAFQAHAIGYLLKPIDLGDVQKQIATIMKRRQDGRQQPEMNHFTVQCLGHFMCFPRGTQDEILHWRTAKAEELFALLLHYRGQTVDRGKIIDTLWPDMDMAKANQNLYVTICYIRNTLEAMGYEQMLVRTRGSYYIRLDGLQCDAVAFMKFLDRAGVGDNHIEHLEKTLALYKGHYLDDKPYDWALSMRAWLESEHEQLQLKLAKAYMLTGETEKALDMYKTIIRFHPLADEAYVACIEMSLEQDDRATASLYYKKYRTILREELGISPPAHIIKRMEYVR